MSGDYSNEIKADVDEGIAFVTGAAYLGEKKGISNLLEAFSKLIHDNGRNDVLYLYGKIDSDIKAAYDKLIEACNIKENVVFCGYLDRPAFEEQMSRADVYIQTSPFEGFGNSVAEALCIGKDILISNTGYIAEVISDDFPDHIIKSLNPDEMAGSIYEYIVRTYSKNDKSEIRKKLSRYVRKNIVIDQWKIVLGDRKSPCINIGMDSCLAVMFHDIDHDYSGVDYGAEGFEKLVKKIYDTGLELCSVRRFFDNPCSDRMIICTFDDGYEGVYKYALPVLKKFGYTATVYICPDLIGQDNAWNHKDVKKRNHLNDEMLVSLVQNGWEIGSHGIAHINLLQLSEHELEKTLSDSKDQLSKYGEIDSFCYPYGSYNLFIKEKVARYYKNAFSVSIGGNNYINDMFQITRVTPEDLIGRLGF
jgi:peptidoglycan/xylan/chitin deacetylase (PgdA/CDA1 family)